MGGWGALESRLREKARTMIRNGILPCVEQPRTWGGPGLSQACALREEPIDDQELEYELEFGDALVVHRFHTHCCAVWELARRMDC